MAMDTQPKLLRYQTLNLGVGSGRDTNTWPYLTHITPPACRALLGAPFVVSLAIRLRNRQHNSHVFYLPTIRPGLHGQ